MKTYRNLPWFTALNQGSDMWRIMDLYGRFYQPPDDGIIINSRIAEKLHLEKGDFIEVSVPGLTTEAVKVPVKAIIKESLEAAATCRQTDSTAFSIPVPLQKPFF